MNSRLLSKTLAPALAATVSLSAFAGSCDPIPSDAPSKTYVGFQMGTDASVIASAQVDCGYNFKLREAKYGDYQARFAFIEQRDKFEDYIDSNDKFGYKAKTRSSFYLPDFLTEIAGGNFTVDLGFNTKKELNNIKFDFSTKPSNADVVFDAFVKKYGEPEVVENTYSFYTFKNQANGDEILFRRMGERFRSQVGDFEQLNFSFSSKEYSADINEAIMASYQSIKAKALEDQRLKDEALKESAKGLDQML